MKPKTASSPSPAQLHAPAPAPEWQAWAGLAGRVLVGGLMLYSGMHKAIAPPEEFMVVLEGYHILPDPHLRLFAVLMPWAETLGGIFLLTGLMTRLAASVTAALSVSFFLALSYTKLRGIELPNCGCFGQGVHLERWQAMLLDVTLIALSVAAWRWGGSRFSLDRWVEAAPQ